MQDRVAGVEHASPGTNHRIATNLFTTPRTSVIPFVPWGRLGSTTATHRDQTERRLRALLERYDFGPCERTDDAIPN